MNKNMLDHIHRGFLSYKALTDDASVDRERRAVMTSERVADRYDSALCTCEVNTDWIERIEAAMPFLERAVRENRQFILRTGETVPIEKVRRVSKTTVEHLARHSEYITREPEEGGDITPDRLLMTENVGTYAVYENRFLYMLLCYIHDFTEIKQQKIVECANFFTSEIEYARRLKGKRKNIEFTLSYKESSAEQLPTELSESTRSALVRIKNILASVDALLRTGLMVEVSTAPMLKPPIARTNVLMQNPSFASAMELYDYLCSYTGDGYEKKDVKRNEGRPDADMEGDLGDIAMLAAYISYRHGGVGAELDRRLSLTLAEEQDREREAREEHIRTLRERIGDVDGAVLEYITELEERTKEDRAELEALRSERYAYAQAQAEAESMREQLELALGVRDEALAESGRLGELIRINEEKHRTELDRSMLLTRQKDAEMQKAVERAGIEAERRVEEIRAQYARLLDSYNLISARLHAREGGDATDYTTKEGFAALEAEYRAFERFFNSEWKKAKAAIRRSRLKKPGSVQGEAPSDKKTDGAAGGTDTEE